MHEYEDIARDMVAEAYGEALPAPISPEVRAEAVKELVRRAQDRLVPPEVEIEPDDAEPDPGAAVYFDDGEGIVYELFGDHLGGDAAAPATESRFPRLRKFFDRFAAAARPRRVRLDDAASYEQFRADRAAPYLAALAREVAALKEALLAHVGDGHGGELPEDFGESARAERLAGEIQRLSEAADCCGAEVPLSLPPFANGKVRCWQDGEEICCSIRVLGCDGEVRIATTGTRAEHHVDEALRLADEADADPTEVVGELPVFAQILGGGSLVPILARTAPVLVGMARKTPPGRPFVARVVPKVEPALAAVMALVHAARRGDQEAAAEVTALIGIGRKSGEEQIAGLIAEGVSRLDGVGLRKCRR